MSAFLSLDDEVLLMATLWRRKRVGETIGTSAERNEFAPRGQALARRLSACASLIDQTAVLILIVVSLLLLALISR